MSAAFALLLFLSSAEAGPRALDTLALRRLSLGTNPGKPFLGLVQLEFEYQFARRFSGHVVSEYLAFNSPLMPEERHHPDWVTRLGARWYFYSFQETVSVSGFYAGLPLGYVWYKDTTGTCFTAGAELGYKFLIRNRFYILPRMIFTYPIGSRTVLPGFEALIGFVF